MNNKNKQQNANRKAIKVLLSIFGVLVVGAVVVGVLLSLRITSKDYNSLFEGQPDTVTAIEDPDSDTPPSQPVKTITYNGKTYGKKDSIVNLLFLGIDSNAERRRESKGYRSDVIIVCAVDTADKSATLISIPRDTYTKMYKLDSDGNVEKTVYNKINAAYSYGGGNRAGNAMACVQMFLQREIDLNEPLGFTLDVPVYFYGSIDMDGISELASAVGGVEVTLDVTIPRLSKSTYTLPSVGKEGETVVLDADTAQNYLRNRSVSGGDIGRAGRQRTFMIALAKKIKSMGAVDMILSLYDDLSKYSMTNLSTDNMLDFAKIMMKVDIDAIKQYSIPGESKRVDGSSVIVHDEKETLDILLDVYYEEMQQ